MQIPIISGIYTDNAGNFRTAYPRNLVPVPGREGISDEYLRPADGISPFATGTGFDRGGINWNNKCYRASGSKLIRIDSDGSIAEIGNISDDSLPVAFDYSYDHLGIASNGKLYLYDGSTLTQVTDPNLGVVKDVIYLRGYWMVTDGEFITVTELTDPFVVNPLKYGSSEADPDPVLSIVRLRNEAVALNRYTIETFANTGTRGFPFQPILGAQIQRGTVGIHANCLFVESIAFVGSGRNEAPSVWLGNNGNSIKLASREIDLILSDYSEDVLSKIVMESRVEAGHQFIYIHLPDQTLVYDASASSILGQPIWHILTSSIDNPLGVYKGRYLVWCYDKWIVGDPTSAKIGYLNNTISSHYGEKVAWEFSTQIIYNKSKGAIFHELELVSLTGRCALNVDPTIYTQYSLDGQTWSQQWGVPAGLVGNRDARITWYQQGYMRNYRIQKFFGTSDSHMSIARLEANLEPLSV